MKRMEMRLKMKHIKTLKTKNLKESMKKGGCGECQTSLISYLFSILHAFFKSVTIKSRREGIV